MDVWTRRKTEDGPEVIVGTLSFKASSHYWQLEICGFDVCTLQCRTGGRNESRRKRNENRDAGWQRASDFQ
jgi:hypothetical protein